MERENETVTWLRQRAASEPNNDEAAKLWAAADLIESIRAERDEARRKTIEEAAQIAEEQADRAREMAGHAKESPFHQESVHGAYFLTMAGTARAIAAAIRNMGGEG